MTSDHELPSQYLYRGFAAQTPEEAEAEFRKRHPQYAESNPPRWWVTTNKTLFVAWDVKHENI